MISAIVAVDKDWGIGYQGQLLEHLPPDMKYFKELTMGNIVIMGRKTWDSLPSKPLPSRTNVVVSSKYCFEASVGRGRAPLVYSNMDYLIPDLLEPHIKDIFIIGGGSIYEQLLPYCDTVFLTHIGKDHKNVDTYFPRIDKDPNWEIDTCTELRESVTGIPYAFITYKRV
jgi:dihydrofolate reductase